MYSNTIMKALEKDKVSTGDHVKVISSRENFEGVLMPRPDMGDESILVLKLDNGYNIGIKFDQNTKIEKSGRPKAKKEMPKQEIDMNKSLPKVTLITTGGTISSSVDYETEQDFQESMTFMEEFRPTITNISKFSVRPHAQASKLKQLDSETTKERSIRMSRFVRRIQKEEFDKHVGKTERVLVVERNDKSLSGRNDSYINVAIMDNEAEIGSFADVRITGNTFAYLIGRELIKEMYVKNEALSKI